MTTPSFTSDISVKLIQKMGGDHMVVAAAKVSTSGEDALKFVDQNANYGLINYLISHRHGTPLEHSSLTFFVHAPQFVWWEWVRHRVGFSYNLESSRYKKLDPIFWVPRKDRKMVPTEKHKSARPDFKAADDDTYDFMANSSMQVATLAYDMYEQALEHNVASEVARTMLPSSIYFSGWVTCNPRSLMHFVSLRTQDTNAKYVSYPQAEIEEAARVCEQILSEGWPLVYKSYVANGRVAP